MNTTININYKPSKLVFNQIKNWLYSEYNEFNFGFYCNINIIEKLFNEKRMAVISVNKYAVGFITWEFPTKFSANIVITEVHPNFRKCGYGKILVNNLLSNLKDKGIMSVSLECAPASSIHFWKKMKFKEFPKNTKSGKFNVELHKILVDTNKPQSIHKKVINSDIIELWSGEPYQTTNKNPDWQWILKLKSKSNQLTKPIIIPCAFDWRIRWRKGDKVLYDEKVKRFNKIKIEYGSYLIIENI